MSGRLLISDANIIIDMNTGGILRPMFRLEVTFAVPDMLFEEELRKDHAELPRLGLKSLELNEESVARAEQLVNKYHSVGVSINDLLALALAIQEKCPLLTGDGRLRTVGEAEGIEVHGTIWLVGELVKGGILSAPQAEAAYDKMRQAGRRLPWEQVDRQLRSYRK